MPINIDCHSYRDGGVCVHQAAPRRWFGPAKCIVWAYVMSDKDDPRQMLPTCALCGPADEARGMLAPPKNGEPYTVQGDGHWREETGRLWPPYGCT